MRAALGGVGLRRREQVDEAAEARPRRRAARPGRTRPPSRARSRAPRGRSPRSSRRRGRAARAAARRRPPAAPPRTGRDVGSICHEATDRARRIVVQRAMYGADLWGITQAMSTSAQDLQPRGGRCSRSSPSSRDRPALERRCVDWSDLAVLAIMYVLTGYGVTLGFHRLLTHRSFATFKPVEYTLAGARLDGGPGPGDDLGRRPPQAPRAHRQGGRPALPARPWRRHQGRARGPLVRAHGLALRPRRPWRRRSATPRTSTRTAACA